MVISHVGMVIAGSGLNVPDSKRGISKASSYVAEIQSELGRGAISRKAAEPDGETPVVT